ncbi:MAG: bifunctional 3-(3-hydroxy-phenyl)propionate/3-hydroxycinnamic acid hydroxylase [Hyphomicrobiaceae bacterium]
MASRLRRSSIAPGYTIICTVNLVHESEATEKDETSYDVCVVGFGPVGATLANLLGLCGLSTLVLEREAEAYHLPRAVHFDDEVMRVFQTIGVAQDVEQVVRINPGMRFVDTNGGLLLDWPRPQSVGPLGWYPSYRFHQPDLERILRNAVKRYAHVDVRLRAEATDIRQQGDSVQLDYHDLAANKTPTVSCKYVVGCDGARSMVRSYLNPVMDDFGFNERWLVVDIVLNQDKAALGDFTIQYCDPSRPITYVRGPGMRRRWEVTMLPDEPSEEMTAPERVWSLLSGWVVPDEAVLERAAVYTFHSLVAKTWSRDRVYLAGDAAHQTPPFMGQGMCIGIRDVVNLAWKLARVVEGRAPGDFLQSYESERRSHAQAYVELAVRLGAMINHSNPQTALDAAYRQSDGTYRMESIRPKLGPGLSVASPRHAGEIFPQPRLSNGAMLDDRIGYRTALMFDAACGAQLSRELQCRLRGDDVALLSSTDDAAIRDCLKTYQADAIVIRPDRYVLGTATGPAEVETLAREILPSALA